MPSGGAPGRLVKRRAGKAGGAVEVQRGERRLRAEFSTQTRRTAAAAVKGADRWADDALTGVYIPVKDTLANAPGFQSLYANAVFVLYQRKGR